MKGAVELRNHLRELRNFQLRLAITAVFVLVMCLVLFARFYYLQVMQREHYHTLAEANRISIAPIVPNRGLIFDRNGEVLAHNYSAYTLEIVPSKVVDSDLETLINELSTVVEIAPRDRKRFKRLMEERKRFESLPIRTRLSDVEVARFAANRYRFPGVEIKARLFRQYPKGESASHVVGYIGRINDKDLEQLEANDDLPNYRGSQ
jgi:penicillin-binding protein 2